jgi:site-specific DNA recombinase
MLPLGYDVKDRKLVVNEREAATVRHIYRRYAALGSVLALKEDLDRDGIVSKVRVDKHGRRTGGRPLARGALYLMLQNRIYRGEIVHKENSYPGEHKPIIDQALWDEVLDIGSGPGLLAYESANDGVAERRVIP